MIHPLDPKKFGLVESNERDVEKLRVDRAGVSGRDIVDVRRACRTVNSDKQWLCLGQMRGRRYVCDASERGAIAKLDLPVFKL